MLKTIHSVYFTCPECGKSTFNLKDGDEASGFKNLECSGCGNNHSFEIQEILRTVSLYNRSVEALKKYELEYQFG